MSGGKTYAACYSNDFRVSMYNKKMFAKAGISSFPATFDELATDVQKLKASGVQYPLVDPDGSHRGRRHAVVPADAGDGRPAVRQEPQADLPDPDSAGYKALQWEVDAVKNGWVSPGSVSLDDPRLQQVHGRRRTRSCWPPARATCRPPTTPSSRASPARPSSGWCPASTARAARSACPRASRSRSRPSTRRRRGLHRVVGAARERDRDLQDPGQPAVRRVRRSSSSPTAASCRAARCDQRAAPRRPAVPGGRADLVLAVQLRRAGPAERGRQGHNERG